MSKHIYVNGEFKAINEVSKLDLLERIRARQKFLKSIRKSIRAAKEAIKEAREELKRRPRKRYKPGFYYSHDANEGALIFIDHEGHPWMYIYNEGWWKFGKSMNDANFRTWERIEDL